jgi:glycosyltransferase involved in cell wall biosynthesis
VDLFHAADMVCVPSRNEPFGIVILEAWSAGKPVIVTQNGGPAEFVRHQQDGISIFDHVDSIAWGLLEGLRDPMGLQAMGSAGRQRALSEFNWETIAHKTEQVYRQAWSAKNGQLPAEWEGYRAAQQPRERLIEKTWVTQTEALPIAA